MSNTKTVDPEIRQQALDIYVKEGAEAARLAVGVSKRTVQRWASDAGLKYEYVAPLLPCPSMASYARGCRCDGCVEANREHQKEVKARRVAYGKKHGKKKTGEPIPHGVSGYSNWDCRCGTCKAEWSAYLRRKRDARTEASV
jgi:hypothetical protein